MYEAPLQKFFSLRLRRQTEHPYQPQLKPATTRDRKVLYACAAISGTAGVGIAALLMLFEIIWPFWLLGLAHAIALAGMLWFTKFPISRAIRYLALCVLFPIWGTFIGAYGFFVFSALLCSLAWGCMLWYLLDDRAAAITFAIIGSLPAVCILTVSAPSGVLSDWMMWGSIGYWHIAASFAVVWLGFRYRTKHSLPVCKPCGYPREGLTPGAPCPECGSRPEPERHA